MKNRKLGIPLTALLLTDCEGVNPAPTDGAQKRSLMLLLSQKDDFMTTLRDRARVAMTGLLAVGTAYNCVICNNDAMALGVIDALRYAGKEIPPRFPLPALTAQMRESGPSTPGICM